LSKYCCFGVVAVQKQIASIPHLRSHDSPGGTKMLFFSEKTLHIEHRVLWMLPFATNTDLNEAAMEVDVSHDSRNGFFQKLLGEHSFIGARQELKELWGKWIETNYGAAGPESTGRGYGAESETPEDSDDDAVSMEASLPDLLPQGQLPQGQLLLRSRQLL
jgi:hypothetical protein